MNFELQPVLENEFIKAIALNEADFEELFSVASDPLIWGGRVGEFSPVVLGGLFNGLYI